MDLIGPLTIKLLIFKLFLSASSLYSRWEQHTWRHSCAVSIQSSVFISLAPSLKIGAAPNLLVKSFIVIFKVQPAIWS